MTTGGWIFMTVSLSAVLTLLLWSYRKILSAPREPDSNDE